MDGKSVKISIMLDRISNLPKNIIDIILSGVPLRVAVQTSILSKKWRIHWTRVKNLVLDKDFVDDIYRGQEDKLLSRYTSIVGNILLSLGGPIRKFVLHIPNFGNTPDAINLWILAASQHGVQDLTLDYENYRDNTIPSYVFQCMELKHLSLNKFSVPLHNFGEFSSLISLEFKCTGMPGDWVTNTILNCPLLERLSLDYTLNDGSFSVSAFKLKLLCVTHIYPTKFFLENTPNLSIISWKYVGNFRENIYIKCPVIVDFFGAVPKIENINITGPALAVSSYFYLIFFFYCFIIYHIILSNWLLLKLWGVQDVSKMLPAPLENHLSLIVCNWTMYRFAQVHPLFCLVNSSPILQTLDISMHNPDYRRQDTSDYLKSQTKEMENLWSLRTVKVAELMGEEPEITFIEIILSRCPVLEKLYLSSHSRIKSDAEFKMMTDIMRFPRASAHAEMIYSKSK